MPVICPTAQDVFETHADSAGDTLGWSDERWPMGALKGSFKSFPPFADDQRGLGNPFIRGDVKRSKGPG
jgi:hypothetical protein